MRIIHVGFVLDGNHPCRGICPGWESSDANRSAAKRPGGNCPGAKCPARPRDFMRMSLNILVLFQEAKTEEALAEAEVALDVAVAEEELKEEEEKEKESKVKGNQPGMLCCTLI